MEVSYLIHLVNLEMRDATERVVFGVRLEASLAEGHAHEGLKVVFGEHAVAAHFAQGAAGEARLVPELGWLGGWKEERRRKIAEKAMQEKAGAG